jgi:hypothetical protein
MNSSKAVNAGPERGNNSFPASNKGRANTSSRGGGGAAGDETSMKADKPAKVKKQSKTKAANK